MELSSSGEALALNEVRGSIDRRSSGRRLKEFRAEFMGESRRVLVLGVRGVYVLVVRRV